MYRINVPFHSSCDSCLFVFYYLPANEQETCVSGEACLFKGLVLLRILCHLNDTENANKIVYDFNAATTVSANIFRRRERFE